MTEGLASSPAVASAVAADAGRLWLEPCELYESRPLRAMRASRSAVSLPDDKVSRLVADHFAPITREKENRRRSGLTLDAVVNQQSCDSRGQAAC